MEEKLSIIEIPKIKAIKPLITDNHIQPKYKHMLIKRNRINITSANKELPNL